MGTLQISTYEILEWSIGGSYYVNLTVGTPPQNQVMLINAGGSNLYFDSSVAPTCRNHDCRGGAFDPNASSTYNMVDVSPAFNISFLDGSTATGPFAEDTVGIGDVSISNVQFDLAEDIDSTTGPAVGIMGLGYSLDEASEQQYANIPEVLVSSGEINSRLYSVFLDDTDATGGSLLFGGIDKSKFSSPLVTLNILPTPGFDYIVKFIATVTALSATNSSSEKEIFSGSTDSTAAFEDSDSALAVLLDPTSAAWFMPKTYYEQGILPSFNYIDSKTSLRDCKHRDSKDSIAVTFGGMITINVPARHFIFPPHDSDTNEPHYFDNDEKSPVCTFMIRPDTSDRPICG